MTGWSPDEIEAVQAAVRAAPSVHNTQPWTLDFHHDRHDGEERCVTLYRRSDRALAWHDPHGRDLLISCGAALTNIRLAMCVLGWDPHVGVYVSRTRPDEVAMVTAGARRSPSTVELDRYAAIPRRHSARRPFADALVASDQRDRLVAASHTAGVELRPVWGEDEIAVLARVFDHAALVLKADRAYQRELSAWTGMGSVPSPGGGMADVPRRFDTLPWAGLVRRDTAIPDRDTLAARLRRECLLLVETPDDGPAYHVRGGMAVQDSWLAATADGLAASLLTQPLQISEVRAGLIEGLTLGGFPQAVLRVGHPEATVEQAAAPDGTEERP
jgi:nitroreductase